MWRRRAAGLLANARCAACRAVGPSRPSDRRGQDAAGPRPVALVLFDRIRRRGCRDSVGALPALDDHQFGVRVHAAARRDPARHWRRQPRHCAAMRPQSASSRRLRLPPGFHGIERPSRHEAASRPLDGARAGRSRADKCQPLHGASRCHVAARCAGFGCFVSARGPTGVKERSRRELDDRSADGNQYRRFHCERNDHGLGAFLVGARPRAEDGHRHGRCRGLRGLCRGGGTPARAARLLPC